MSIFSNYINTYTYSKYVEARRAGLGEAFSVSYTTFKKIDEMMRGLTSLEKDRTIRQGLRNAGNYLVRRGKQRLKARLIGVRAGSAAERRASKQSLAVSNLYNSFKVRVKRRSLGAIVGFDRLGHHAHLVDRGTKLRSHPITGNSGRMPANKFWTDTANEDWRGAMNTLQESVGRAVTRAMLRRD